MKKTNMKFTCVFDGELSAGDIFSAFLLEEFEKERTKRKSRKSDFFIDADVNLEFFRQLDKPCTVRQFLYYY